MVSPISKKSIRAAKMIAAAKQEAKSFDNPMFGDMYVHAVEQQLEGNNAFLRFIKGLREPPVDIETFLDSKDFMGATDLKLWPVVRETIIAANKYWWKGVKFGAIQEQLLVAATGSGKSEICKVSMAYLLHILGCMKSPQSFYDLPSSTSIVISVQAAKPHVTKKIIYIPLRKYIEEIPWFRRHLRPNKYIESEMYFVDLNIRVVQGGSDSDAILGDAILAAVVDEINYIKVITRSKKADVSSSGRTGTYDQAQNVYEALVRRRKSRFITQGPQLGQICISSSRRYKGDFTDRRQKQVENSDELGVLVYDKAQYEAQPASKYCGEKFTVVIMNNASADIRILDEGEKEPRGAEVFHVPVEYKDEFIKSPAGSVRDIIGRSVNSISPFFKNRKSIEESIERGREKGLQSILVKDNVILGIEGLPMVKRGTYCQNPSRPRYVHIDLSATCDNCGISMVRFDGMVDKKRATGEIEKLPMATVEMALSIEPDHGAEIDAAEIRAWVKQLKDIYGYPIKAVSYDGFSSLESRQQWKKIGMKTGLVSLDRTTAPYRNLRDAFTDGRIDMYPQATLMEELYSLEFDGDSGKDGKVDHSSSGSKDIADAVCGAYQTLLTRASTWLAAFEDDGRSADMLQRSDSEEVERFADHRQD
jgi:hypothetical protein